MAYTILNIVAILLLLLAERLCATLLTKRPRCQQFIRRHWFLHPNGISVMRIPQGVIAVIIAASGHWGMAIFWFAFWMITDLTDGTIARNCDLETPTGKWLDPFSDKCMSFPALLYMALAGSPNMLSPKLPLGWVIAYCVIDSLGQASRLFCRKKAANSFGKVKTALITVLIALVALNQLRLPPIPFFNEVFVLRMTQACVILAFLSLYCKVIPNHWYANSLTLLNFICGLLAIGAATQIHLKNNFIIAFLLIFAGQFFDLFDGKLARKFGSTKRGAFFDDIADATSFGVAIATITFVGLWTKEEGPLPLAVALAVALIYLASVIFRLYRFLHPTRDYPKGIFQGMPSPAGALLTGTVVIATVRATPPNSAWLSAFLVLLASFLRVSTIPYRHFGQNLWPTMPRGLRAFLLLAVIVFVCCGLAKREYGRYLTLLFAFLSIAYAILAIASPGYLRRLREAQQDAAAQAGESDDDN